MALKNHASNSTDTPVHLCQKTLEEIELGYDIRLCRALAIGRLEWCGMLFLSS